MKLDKDKLKKFWESKYRKPILFLGFYLVFFLFLYATVSPKSNSDSLPDAIPQDMWKAITNNYEYQYEIKTSHGDVISYAGKKYNNKNLYTMTIDDTKVNEVYIFYNEMYMQKDGLWVEYENPVSFDYVIDEFLLKPDAVLYHIKGQVMDAELMETVNNFDGTKSEFYTFGNRSIEVISDNNVLKKMIVVDNNAITTLQYRNINKVNDFVVEK